MIKVNEIKAALARAEMTQEELAEKLGMNASTLNRKINDATGASLTVKEAQDLVAVLKVPRRTAQPIFFP